MTQEISNHYFVCVFCTSIVNSLSTVCHISHLLSFISFLFLSFPVFCCFSPSFPFLSTSFFLLPYFSSFSTKERNAVIFLLLPKPPLENIDLIKVKGKGLKQKVFHASCEWYAVQKMPKVPTFCVSICCCCCCCSFSWLLICSSLYRILGVEL